MAVRKRILSHTRAPLESARYEHSYNSHWRRALFTRRTLHSTLPAQLRLFASG